MIKQIGIRLAMALLAVAPLVARGAVGLGDKPEWTARTIDGNQTGSAALDGKMVLLDFWATWCGPCMAEVPHMLQINQKYEAQGLVLVGISLDNNAGAWKQAIETKGMRWMHSLDSQNRPRVSAVFGVGPIPHAFLINPDGEVIWAGHPGGIDAPLAAAFKKFTPRVIDKKLLADATAALDQAEAAVKGKDLAAAVRALAKFPPQAAKEKTIAARSEKLRKELSACVSDALAEADQLLGKHDYAGAIARLEPIAVMPGLAEAPKAAEKLAAIKAMPETKAAAAAAAKAELEKSKAGRSEELLAAARKLKAEKKDEQAYLAFKDVARQFTALPAGTAAAEEVAAYEKDPVFVKRANAEASQAKARAMLTLANGYRDAGKTDQARTKYQAVIEQFPGTPSAAAAKKALDVLPKD